MAEVVLFHHVLGLTPGVDAFAAELGRHGHVVHTPDLFDGRTFPDLDAGIAFLDEPFTEFADRWPERVPVQIHGMDGDPFFAGEGDLDAARALVDHAAATTTAEVFTYPGDRHLFADSSLDSYDLAAAALLTARVLAFLDGVDQRASRTTVGS